MRLILMFGCLFAFFSGKAQIISGVNFDEIRENISDTSSSYYYPKLRERVLQKDTSLTHQEFYHLYYGTVFQKYYYPYGTSNAKKDFLVAYEKHDYEKALKKGDTALMQNPVDLEILLKMSISCLKLERNEEKRYYGKLYYSLLDVIYYSGDGKYAESAYVVISVDHEYHIAGDLGLRVTNQQLISDCDLLTFSKKDQARIKGRKKIKELYFNVRMPLMSLSNSFKDADLPDPDDGEE
ncbi:MAG: DUF4919 domain-containing protein [Crocinitomicaceae bacterium]|nr:DUF4919 domain-containing protein [Crocinitomicaceae bacterium]